MVSVVHSNLSEVYGQFILFRGPMNGGKTRELIELLSTYKNHGSVKVLAFSSTAHPRDGNDRIAENETIWFPAPSVSTVAEMEKIILESDEPYNPVRIIGIDEINLFSFDLALADFITRMKSEERCVAGSGLDLDFRANYFGNMAELIKLADQNHHKKPVCKNIVKGVQQCDNLAVYTQKLWRADGVKQYKKYAGGTLPFVHFFNKEGNQIREQFIAAPFFSQTIEIEAKKGEPTNTAYIPVCSTCFKLPYKRETFGLYWSIIRKEKVNSRIDKFLEKQILRFLVNENWIRQTVEGNYESIPYYRAQHGGFSKD